MAVPPSMSHPLLLFIPMLALLLPTASQAHVRSQSYSIWSLQEHTLTGTFRTAAVEVTRLGALEPLSADLTSALAEHLASTVRVDGERPCTPSRPKPLRSRQGTIAVELRFQCPQSDHPLSITIGAFFAVAPGHLHFAKVRSDDEIFERVLSEGTQQLSIDNTSLDWRRAVGRYGALGVEHILSGLDHLAFVLGLILLCGFSRQLLIAVTGFTLGHSLTLSLAALGLVSPEVPAIEALIGFTIALVAVERLVRDGDHALAGIVAALIASLSVTAWLAPSVLSPVNMLGLALFALCYLRLIAEDRRGLTLLMTTLFGFIHGFGFAAVLLELGLPAATLTLALVSFNLGVELGQLFFIVALAGAWKLATRVHGIVPSGFQRVDWARPVVLAGLCGLGLYWFVSRAFSGPI